MPCRGVHELRRQEKEQNDAPCHAACRTLCTAPTYQLTENAFLLAVVPRLAASGHEFHSVDVGVAVGVDDLEDFVDELAVRSNGVKSRWVRACGRACV